MGASSRANGMKNGNGAAASDVLPHHKSPPQSKQPLTILRKKRTNESSSILRIIAVAIVFVLAFHWYLVLHHVAYHAPRSHGTSFFHHKKSKASRVGVKGSSSSSTNNNSHGGKKPPYELSPVCGGCYRTYSHNTPCFDLVQKRVLDKGMTLYEASKDVATNQPDCSICNPDTCYSHHLNNDNKNSDSSSSSSSQQYQTKYWRFDQTSPRFTSPTSLVLPSIPDEVRVPPDQFDNIVPYLKEKYAHPDPGNITNVVLFEYNPGLTQIPESMRAYLPWNARYLLSLRVTPHNLCFPKAADDALTEDIKQTMHSINHLGLALLDEKYQMIPGHDVVIDLDRQLDAKREGFMGEPPFVDYRLFTLNDEIYLHINSDTVILTKMKLRSKGMEGSGETEGNKKRWTQKTRGWKENFQDLKLTNLYGGDQFEVSLAHQFNTIWGEGRHSVYGKNFALFTIPNAASPTLPHSVYAEMSVFPTHMVQQIVPDEFEQLPKDRRIKWRQRRNFMIDHMIQRKMKSIDNATKSESVNGWPVPSFFTADEFWFPGGKNPFKEFAHGGACCVSFSLEQMESLPFVAARRREGGSLEGVDSLFVGVGHTLVKVSVAEQRWLTIIHDLCAYCSQYLMLIHFPFILLPHSITKGRGCQSTKGC